MAGEAVRAFTFEDKEGWEALTVVKGQVIETDLPVSEDVAAGDAICAFLVQKVLLSVTGDLLVMVKSLGSEDPGLAKQMSAAFNRKRGAIHLCGGACRAMGNHPLHLGSLRIYEGETYEADFVGAYAKKNFQKWLEEDIKVTGEEGQDYLDLDGIELSSGEEAAARAAEPAKGPLSKKDPGAGMPAVRRSRLGAPGAGGAHSGETSAGDKRGIDQEALKARLAALRQRLTGLPPGGGAAPGALPPLPGAEEPEARPSLSPGYSPSLADERLEDGTHLPPGRDVGGPSGSGKEKKKRRAKAEDHREERDREDRLEVLRGGTSSTLQRQLVQRATDTALRKAEDKKAEKRKHRKKDVSAQLLRILTKGSRSSKKRKKDGETSKKKKKRKRRRGEKGGSQDPDHSSSPTSSYGGSSSGHSDGESSSESLEMDAPLKKRSKEKPGSVLALLVEHARQQLDQTSKVSVQPAGRDNPTRGIKLSSYFSIVVRPQLGQISGPVREMHLLANALDLLRQGDLDVLGDLLASRFMSVHQSLLDGGWSTARHLELMPMEDSTAAGNAIVLQARKHAKLAAKLNSQEYWTGSAGGRGRGGRGKGQQWGDSHWPSNNDGKAKGKKGGKGKGKKGGWPAPSAGEGDNAQKTREKLPDK